MIKAIKVEAMRSKRVIVTLDGVRVAFNSVTIYPKPTLAIRIELKTGEIIDDDGSRVEVLFHSL